MSDDLSESFLGDDNDEKNKSNKPIIKPDYIQGVIGFLIFIYSYIRLRVLWCGYNNYKCTENIPSEITWLYISYCYIYNGYLMVQNKLPFKKYTLINCALQKQLFNKEKLDKFVSKLYNLILLVSVAYSAYMVTYIYNK
jgi:hypothetical protein